MKQKKNTLKKVRRTSTKKVKMGSEMTQSAPRKSQNSTLSQILIVVGIAIVIILGIMLYRFGTVGQATKVQEAPSLESYDLDIDAEQNINVDNLEKVTLKLTPSGEKEATEYTLLLTKNDDGSLSYDLSGYGSAEERITETVGGGDIYLQSDEIADLFVSYADPYFYIKNLNYKEPEDVKIVLSNELGDDFVSFVTVTPATKIVLLFNATSSELPSLTVAWENGTEFTAEELTEAAAGEKIVDETVGTVEKFVTKKLEWTPTIAGANVLSVIGTVGEKEPTTKRYVIAAGSIVYELDEKNLPKISVKKKDKSSTMDVTLTFSDKAMMQPFSLPCGGASLADSKSIPDEMLNKVDSISSYYGWGAKYNIWQWGNKVPSDFTKLEANKGYSLQRKEKATGDIVLSVTCGANPLTLPDSIQTFNQPSLKSGWNLVGISGYEPVKVEQLSLPPYKKITLLYAIDNEGADTTTTITELLPGRAYWVMVQ